MNIQVKIHPWVLLVSPQFVQCAFTWLLQFMHFDSSVCSLQTCTTVCSICSRGRSSIGPKGPGPPPPSQHTCLPMIYLVSLPKDWLLVRFTTCSWCSKWWSKGCGLKIFACSPSPLANLDPPLCRVYTSRVLHYSASLILLSQPNCTSSMLLGLSLACTSSLCLYTKEWRYKHFCEIYTKSATCTCMASLLVCMGEILKGIMSILMVIVKNEFRVA